MKKITTLILARWLIPVEPENVVWENYAIAIAAGRIVDLLPASEARACYQAEEEIVLDHHVVMPGLINAHTHSPMVLLRGFGDDLPLMDWLKQVIWPAENRCLNEAFVRDGTKLAIGEMIRSGTTCFNEHYFFPGVMAQVAEQAGIRARIGVLLMEAQNPWTSTLQEAMDEAVALLGCYQNHPLISVGLAPHASYTLSDDALNLMRQAIDTCQFPLHVHMHETHAEIEHDRLRYHKRPLRRFYDAQLLSAQCQLVHMTQVVEEDMRILKETSASVIHCPASNMKLASGACPVQSLLDAGVNVGLGTDGAASSNSLDLFQAIYLAALLGKLVTEEPSAVSAMTALKLATIHGAKALGLEHETGSLKIGKSADMIAVDMHCFNATPLYHPISQMVYATQGAQVSDVWVRGRCLLKAGVLTTLDEKMLLNQANVWRERVESMVA